MVPSAGLRKRISTSGRFERTLGKRRARLRFIRFGLPAGLCAAALCLSSLPDTPSPAPPPEVAPPAAPVAPIAPAPPPPVEVALRSGETLGGVLERVGVAVPEVFPVVTAIARHVDPRKLKPGDRCRVWTGVGAEGGGVVEVELALPRRGVVHARREAQVWRSVYEPSRRELRERSVTGVLHGSLDASLRAAGADPALAYRMADVLQWDVDFNRDLRAGDRFEVLYQEQWVDGAYDGPGTILALSYQNGGRRLEAYRYADRGYYDGEGKPLQKMFLRSPLPYSRITSRFSNRRFHPILKVYRPHHGIDYGAPVGTPVRVTAGGVVAFAGWDGGGGKTVKVRHPNGYLTAYLHLSRYAEGVRAGARVRQGDVIGHVGATGLATAAHLDYRVQRQGRWIDPLGLAQVPAPDIPAAELAEFRSLRDALRSSLGQATLLADAAPGAVEGGALPSAAARR